jgi:hypothetical protein
MTASTEPATREAYIRVPRADMMTRLGFESLHHWLTENNEQTDWLPRQIFLLDPRAAASTDPVFELAVSLQGDGGPRP